MGSVLGDVLSFVSYADPQARMAAAKGRDVKRNRPLLTVLSSARFGDVAN